MAGNNGATRTLTVFTPQGNNRRFFTCKDRELIASGPAETGKTFAALWKVHLCCAKYPGTSAVLVRKQQTDTHSTVLRIFTTKILPIMPVCQAFGGSLPKWYDYPQTGSRLWVTGMDKAGKVLSGEHDIIYVNQAEELSLAEFETLTTRTTGRAGNMPYAQTIGDCNPGPPTHWIRTRSNGPLTLIPTTHKDNPSLWSEAAQEWTEQGKRTLFALSQLTGSRYKRLFQGLWATSEGAIYDIFEEKIHKVVAFQPDPIWPRVVGIDPVGTHTAAVWLAYDPASRILNAYREYYQPFGETTPGHVDAILAVTRHHNETIWAWCGGGPSERQPRTDWYSAGIPLREPPIKGVWAGIDRIYQLLKDQTLLIHDSCPTLLSEIGDYRRKTVDGIVTDDIEHKDRYHMLDALRYAVVWLTEPSEGEGTSVAYEPVRIPGPVGPTPDLRALRSW